MVHCGAIRGRHTVEPLDRRRGDVVVRYDIDEVGIAAGIVELDAQTVFGG